MQPHFAQQLGQHHAKNGVVIDDKDMQRFHAPPPQRLNRADWYHRILQLYPKIPVRKST
jgi:hypothetical protein